MKQDIFEQYSETICKKYDITIDELYSDSREIRITDARYMLYYLCYNRPMTLKHIQNYLSRAGKSVVHSTIIYGINKIKEQMVHDDDLRKVVLDLMEENNGL